MVQNVYELCDPRMRSSDGDTFVLVALLFAKGSLIVLVSVIALVQRKRVSRDWPQSEGVIEGSRHDKDGNLLLTVCFRSQDGSKHRIILPGSDGVGLGSVVNVAYDPRNPDRAVIVGQGGVRFAPYFAFLVGAMLIYAGCHLLE